MRVPQKTSPSSRIVAKTQALSQDSSGNIMGAAGQNFASALKNLGSGVMRLDANIQKAQNKADREAEINFKEVQRERQAAYDEYERKQKRSDAFTAQKMMNEFESAELQRLAEAQRATSGPADNFAKTFYEEGDERQKAFLDTLPESAREEAAARLSGVRQKQLAKALTFEYSTKDAHYKQELSSSYDEAQKRVLADPDTYQTEAAKLVKMVNESDIPEALKAGYIEKFTQGVVGARFQAKAIESFKAAGSVGHGPNAYNRAPKASGVIGQQLQTLGDADTSGNYLSRLAQIESGGDPNAKNKSGAAGLFQIMPATANEYGVADPHNVQQAVAFVKRFNAKNKNLFKQTFGRTASDGEAYLMHQQGAGGAIALLQNPNEPAWKVLGSKQKVLQNGGNLDMTASEFANKWINKFEGVAGATLEPKANLEVVFAHQAGRGSTGTPVGTSPKMLDMWKTAQNAFGKQVPIVSAYRDKDHNAAVGGAKNSKHIDGEAFDLDVSGLSKQERIELIQTVSAAGFTGIGVYNNSIHVDLGKRRSWGSENGAAPSWAQAAIEAHLSGKTPSVGSSRGTTGAMQALQSDPAYSMLNYQQQVSYTKLAEAQAQQDLAESQRQQKLALDAQRDEFLINLRYGDGTYEERRSALDEQISSGMFDDYEKRNQAESILKDVAETAMLKEQGAAKLNSGGLWNPDDKDDMKRLDAVTNIQALQEQDADYVTGELVPMTQATNIIAPKAAGMLEAMRQRPDTEEFATQALLQLREASPLAFARRFDEKTESMIDYVASRVQSAPLASVIAEYKELQKDTTGPIREQRAKEAEKMLSPKGELADFVADIPDKLFDPGIFSSEPDLPLHPDQAALLGVEAKRYFKDNYVKLGDVELAQAAAERQIKKTWGPQVGQAGSTRLMKFPPSAMGYDLEDAEYAQQAREALGIPASSQIELVGDKKTAEAFAQMQLAEKTGKPFPQGRMPSYHVVEYRDGGIYKVHDKRVNFEITDDIKEKRERKELQTVQENQVQHLKNKRELIYRTAGVGQVKDISFLPEEQQTEMQRLEEQIEALEKRLR